MADWRGKKENPEQPSQKDMDAVPKSLPVIPPIPKTSFSDKDWRGGAKKRSADSDNRTERRWTGSADPTTTQPRSFRRPAIVGFIALATLACIAAFCIYLMPVERPLPLHLSVSEDYRDWGNGENYFGKQTLDMYQSLPSNTRYIDVRKSKDFADGLARQLSISTQLENAAFQLGGPNNNVEAYFFSSILIRDRESDELCLMHGGQDESSAASGEALQMKSSAPGILMKTLFERIAERTPPNAFSWIILDCKLGPEIGSSVNLEFPADAIEKAFTNTKHKERLIVTLPCKEKEENWYAPEYGCTWFSRALFEGLSTGFDKTSRVISVDAFHNMLSKRVNSDVGARRHATQNPWFLMDSKPNNSSIALVRSSGSDPGIAGTTNFRTQKAEIENKYKELDDLWRRFQKLQRCVSSHPIEYSIIEANLILLEDFAEHNSPKFPRILNEIDRRVQSLENDLLLTRRVSLIETLLHGHASFEDDERYKKCLQIWNTMESAAIRDDASQWQDTLAPDRLRKQLAELPPLPADQKEWLEIQWIKILLEETVWPRSSITSQHFETIALIVRYMAALQRIHCNPNFELSRWTKQLLDDDRLDEQLAQTLDRLVVGRFDEANRTLKDLKGPFEILERRFAQLQDAMYVRDFVSHYVPHVLVWQSLRERYGEFENINDKIQSAQRFSSLLSELMKSAKLASVLLSNDKFPATDNMSETRQKFRSLLDEIRAEHQATLANRERDPQLARYWRNMLRFPMTDVEDRKELHRRLIEFYDAEQPPGGKSEKITHLPPSAFFESFASEMKDVENDWFAKSIVSDSRLHLIPSWAQQHQNDLASMNAPHLYSVAQQARHRAIAIGQTLSGHETVEQEWPFCAPRIYRQLCTEYYAKRHVERHCEWKLGDGDLRTRNKHTYYFAAISQSYIDWILRKNEKFNSAYSGERIRNADLEELRDPAYQLLARMDWELRPGNEDRALRIIRKSSGTESSRKTPSIAGVSVAASNSRSQRIPIGGELIQEIRLDRNDEVQLPIENVSQDSNVYFSYRGHFLSEMIPKKESDKTYSITFTREAPAATIEVAVDSVRPEEFVILLDCSGSFGNKHQDAKNAISKLLQLLREIDNDRIRKVQVQLFVFGRAYRGTELDPKTAPPAGLFRINHQILATKMLSSNTDRFDVIRKTVEHPWIQPDAGTPLFDAIFKACEEKEKGIRRNIIVVSDGINSIEGWKPLPGTSVQEWSNAEVIKQRRVVDPYDGPCHSFDDVTKELRRTNSQIFVYQYFDPSSSERERIEAEDFQRRSRKEWTFADPNKRILYNSWNEIENAIKQQFQLPQVLVRDAESTVATGNLNKEISVTPQARIASISTDPNANLEIRIQGNERVQLKYDPDRNRLASIPFDQEQREYRLSPQFRSEQTTEKRLLLGVTSRVNEKDVFEPKVIVRGQSEDAELGSFISRPKYALAEIRKSNDRQSRAILLSDWIYEHTHYPSIQFPAIKWKPKRDSKPHPFDMTVWLFDQLPLNDVRSVQIKANEEKTIDDISADVITCVRNNNQLTVEIQNKSEDQYFVVCRESQHSQRTLKAENDFPVTGPELHRFQVDDTLPTVTVDIIPLNRLKNRKGVVTGVEVFTILDQIP